MTPATSTRPRRLRIRRTSADALLDGEGEDDLLMADGISLDVRQRAHGIDVAADRPVSKARHYFQNMSSANQRMLEVFDLIEQVADSSSTVLVVGETGTGKEQVARAVHQASNRKDGPFVAVNCGALNENLLESELFGHEKGSFTGATVKRTGRFELADGGTLFLDEVGDMPQSMQVRLLRVLQERHFERVGGCEPIAVDVRVIAATHRSLEALIKNRKFRDDLYYRLNVVRMDLPPLRERPEDICLLAAEFCRRFARPGQPPKEISAEAMAVLLRCPWPGNIRQLENAIERGCVTACDGVICLHNLPPELTRQLGANHCFDIDLSRPLPVQVAEMTAAFERRYIRRAMGKTHGHIGKCAQLCGLSRRSISDRVAQYKLDKSSFKRDEE